MPVLGTVLGTPIFAPTFHGLWDSPEPANAGHSQFGLLLIVTILHSPILLRHRDGDAQAIPKRHGSDMRCRRYPQGTGILTRFPFLRVGLRAELGPTNPQLMNIAEEPLLIK